MGDRQKKRDEFSKRGTAQAQQRMQKIVELGKEDKMTGIPEVEKKTMNKDTTRDNFGMDD